MPFSVHDHGRLTTRFVHRLARARDFQERDEVDAIAAWWRSGGAGVCSLEGLGGAGKTALVDRFLRRIPGVMPADPQLGCDPTLPTPCGVLRGEPDDSSEIHRASGWIYSALSPFNRALLVLDGLERIQNDDSRSGTN
jgi:hypothetical protein